MEVDHFNPKLTGAERHRYENLFLATRHCNLAKRDHWPTDEDLAAGIRFLNPCEEQDYGVHLFEDPATHELVGVTPAGRWHIEILLLNASHLVEERRRRTRFQQLQSGMAALVSRLEEHADPVEPDRRQAILDLIQRIDLHSEELEVMIPEIPALREPDLVP